MFPRSKSIHFQHFHHPEGWREKASGRHEGTESVCEVSSIQDGEHEGTESVCEVSSIQDGEHIATERCLPERELHDKAGSSRHYSSKSKIKDLFKIFLEEHALSVHMASIRPLPISKVVHQDIEASDCLSKIYGDSSANLLRRHPHNGRFSGASCGAHRNSDEGPGISRLRDKEKEVNLGANPGYPVSRLHCKFATDAPSIARKKPAKIKVISFISSRKYDHSQ